MTMNNDDNFKKNIEEENNNNQDSDIQELSDAFENYMDNIIDEEKKAEINKISKESPLKDILPDLTSPYNADNITEDGTLDEDELSVQFDEGYFENKEKEQAAHNIIDDYEELSESREKRIFYAALYLSGKPVEISTFSKMLNPINLENRLISYAEEFNNMNIGVRIRMVSGGYQIVADSEVTIFLEKYFG